VEKGKNLALEGRRKELCVFGSSSSFLIVSYHVISHPIISYHFSLQIIGALVVIGDEEEEEEEEEKRWKKKMKNGIRGHHACMLLLPILLSSRDHFHIHIPTALPSAECFSFLLSS
jgi:hypothetical protein